MENMSSSSRQDRAPQPKSTTPYFVPALHELPTRVEEMVVEGANQSFEVGGKVPVAVLTSSLHTGHVTAKAPSSRWSTPSPSVYRPLALQHSRKSLRNEYLSSIVPANGACRVFLLFHRLCPCRCRAMGHALGGRSWGRGRWVGSSGPRHFSPGM